MGVAVFALHKAVLESRHPMLRDLPPRVLRFGSALTLSLEFLLLVAALAMATSGHTWAAVLYGLYTGLNALSAWAILTRRM